MRRSSLRGLFGAVLAITVGLLSGGGTIEAWGCQETVSNYLLTGHTGSTVSLDALTKISGCSYATIFLDVSCTVKKNGSTIWSGSNGAWDDNGNGTQVNLTAGPWSGTSGDEFTSSCAHEFLYPQNANNYYTSDSFTF